MGVSWLACINQIKLAILFRSVIKCRCFLTRPTQHWEKTHWVDKLILWICKQPCKQLTTTILLIHLNTKTIHKNWLLYNVIILTLKNGIFEVIPDCHYISNTLPPTATQISSSAGIVYGQCKPEVFLIIHEIRLSYTHKNKTDKTFRHFSPHSRPHVVH